MPIYSICNNNVVLFSHEIPQLCVWQATNKQRCMCVVFAPRPHIYRISNVLRIVAWLTLIPNPTKPSDCLILFVDNHFDHLEWELMLMVRTSPRLAPKSVRRHSASTSIYICFLFLRQMHFGFTCAVCTEACIYILTKLKRFHQFLTDVCIMCVHCAIYENVCYTRSTPLSNV